MCSVQVNFVSDKVAGGKCVMFDAKVRLFHKARLQSIVLTRKVRDEMTKEQVLKKKKKKKKEGVRS